MRPMGCSTLTGDQQIQIRILQIEPLAEMEVRQRSFEQVDTAAEMYLMPYQVLESSFFSRLQQQRHQHIADSMRSRTGKTRGDIRNTIMDHPVFHEDGMLMGGDLAGLKTAAPVDANVDDHTPRPHIA